MATLGSWARPPPPPPAPPPAAAAVPTAAPTAARARRLGELDLQRPAIDLLTVELLDCGLGRLGRRHLDEAKPARAPGVTVRYDRGRFDPAGLSEQLPQPLAGRRERQASDEELLCHRAPPGRSSAIDVTPWNAEEGARVVVW